MLLQNAVEAFPITMCAQEIVFRDVPQTGATINNKNPASKDWGGYPEAEVCDAVFFMGENFNLGSEQSI